MQIDKVVQGRDNIITHLDQLGTTHPHGFGDLSRYSNNTIYISKKNLTFNNKEIKCRGHGLFRKTHRDLVLTEENSSRSNWKLPKKFFSKTNNLFLNRLKWKDELNCLVDCLGYGQEFILNAEKNPNIIDWAVKLIKDYG